jgi:WD40 repeat protein
LLAAGASDHVVVVWDPTTGAGLCTLIGHDGPVEAIHALALGSTTFLATAGYDRTVRIWDPAKAVCILIVPTRDPALSVAYAEGLLFVGTASGLLAIRLDLDS